MYCLSMEKYRHNLFRGIRNGITSISLKTKNITQFNFCKE